MAPSETFFFFFCLTLHLCLNNHIYDFSVFKQEQLKGARIKTKCPLILRFLDGQIVIALRIALPPLGWECTCLACMGVYGFFFKSRQCAQYFFWRPKYDS